MKAIKYVLATYALVSANLSFSFHLDFALATLASLYVPIFPEHRP